MTTVKDRAGDRPHQGDLLALHHLAAKARSEHLTLVGRDLRVREMRKMTTTTMIAGLLQDGVLLDGLLVALLRRHGVVLLVLHRVDVVR